MPRKSDRPHRAALTRMLRSTGLAQIPEEAPLVELLRTLADEVDAGGGSRPRTEYRNALKDARAVLTAAPGRPKTTAEPAAMKPEPETVLVESPPVPNQLAEFKKKRGIAS